jgi:hypothetical protein
MNLGRTRGEASFHSFRPTRMAKRRKDPYYHRGEPGRWNQLLKVVGVLFVIAVVLGGAWTLTLFQPRKIKNDDPEMQQPIGEVPKEVSAMLDQSKELEKNFTDATQARDITPDDLVSLRHAIQLQLDYLEETQNHNLAEGNARLNRMTIALETYEAKPLRAQSLDLEQKAKGFEAQNDLDNAKKSYTQASNLEAKIMKDDPKGDAYDSAVSRNVELRHRVDYLTALPLHNESLADEAAGEAALAQQDWAAAQKSFQLAHDLQAEINQKFPEQSFVSADRLDSLDKEVTALRSLPDYQRVQKSLADAQAADNAGDALKAAQLYQDAYREQDDLDTHFPDSRFADPSQLAKIQAQLETAQSRPLATEIKTQTAALFDDLRNRRSDKVSAAIAVLYEKATQFHVAFPQSDLLDADLQKRLDFLYYKRDDLAAIQEQAYRQLAALPGQKTLQLAKQEVTQSFYALVAGGSPSRNAGPQLPVESVNWTDTQEFCLHLSWILARPVRLPTVEEYRAALGATDSLDLAAASWNFDNSGSQTHEVATKAANANGFYDLLGNVAEWLERSVDEDDDKAPIIGGNAITPVDNIRQGRVTEVARDVRNPYTGFRFVVDTDDSIPALPAPAVVKARPEPTYAPEPAKPVQN